jgi:hypothetical protein
MPIIPPSGMAANSEFDLLTRVRKASQRCISLRGTVRCEGRPQFSNVRNGSGTEIPYPFGTSGSMRIAALGLRSQACQEATLEIDRHCGGCWQRGY